MPMNEAAWWASVWFMWAVVWFIMEPLEPANGHYARGSVWNPVSSVIPRE